mgnify:CR=1 FL=1
MERGRPRCPRCESGGSASIDVARLPGPDLVSGLEPTVVGENGPPRRGSIDRGLWRVLEDSTSLPESDRDCLARAFEQWSAGSCLDPINRDLLLERREAAAADLKPLPPGDPVQAFRRQGCTVLVNGRRIGIRPTEIPERIGRYQILCRLGEGGMGLVYIGWRPDLERELAIN